MSQAAVSECKSSGSDSAASQWLGVSDSSDWVHLTFGPSSRSQWHPQPPNQPEKGSAATFSATRSSLPPPAPPAPRPYSPTSLSASTVLLRSHDKLARLRDRASIASVKAKHEQTTHAICISSVTKALRNLADVVGKHPQPDYLSHLQVQAETSERALYRQFETMNAADDEFRQFQYRVAKEELHFTQVAAEFLQQVNCLNDSGIGLDTGDDAASTSSTSTTISPAVQACFDAAADVGVLRERLDDVRYSIRATEDQQLVGFFRSQKSALEAELHNAISKARELKETCILHGEDPDSLRRRGNKDGKTEDDCEAVQSWVEEVALTPGHWATDIESRDLDSAWSEKVWGFWTENEVKH